MMDANLSRKLFFAAQSVSLSRCLAPGMKCTEAAIRAHSVQNSRVIDFLEDKGHVIAPALQLSRDNKLETVWKHVGRNLATTFEGFCSTHDSQIFLPIDSHPFNALDPEQMFLYAYRAVVRELHASMQSAQQLQTGYGTRIKEGLDTGNTPEAAGMFALNQMLNAYSTNVYKEALDEALLSKNYSILEHETILFEAQPPTFAASIFFDLDNRRSQEEPPRVVMNLLPISQRQSVLQISFTAEDRGAVREYLSTIFETTGLYQKYLLSRVILMHAENFVISPRFFAEWSEQKKRSVLEFFHKTAQFNSSEESEHLFLF